MNNIVFTILMLITIHTHSQDKIDFFEYDSWIADSFNVNNFKHEEDIINLAKPASITQKNSSLNYPNKIFKTTEYEFDGLTVCAEVEQGTKKSYIFSAIIDSDKWSLSNGIKVGDPIQKLDTLPFERDGYSNKYCSEANCIEFHTENGKIIKITYMLYVG